MAAGTKKLDDGIVRKDDILEASVESLAFGGEGVLRVQSGEKPLVVFVEDVVPGDKVEIKIGTKKKNFARGYVQKVLSPSKDRIAPHCAHFGQAFEHKRPDGSAQMSSMKGCGGCVWQFLSLEKQREYKEQQVRDALKRIGGLDDHGVLPILGGDAWFYRNKMEFSFSKTLEGKLTLGLHLRRRHHDVVELTECHLLEPYAGKLVEFVRGFFRDFEKNTGFDPELTMKSFTVRVGKNTGEVMMIITAENGEENFMASFQKALLDYCHQHSIPVTSLYFLHIQNKKGSRTVIHEKLIHGSPVIEETLQIPGGQVLKFQISPQAFFQPNTKTAELLYTLALEAADLTGKETVFDLYCGTGTIGLFCSSRAAKVYGIELNASAIANAKQNAQLNTIHNAEFLVGDVLTELPKLSSSPDVVLVDPPRNGLATGVVESLANFHPRKIVYVSCNPTSLARDAAMLVQRGYHLHSVQPVDQFPHTYHIECVALFERA